MATVMCGLAMSLDGFIAGPEDDIGSLFDWYGNDDVVVLSPDPQRTFHTSAASAGYLRELFGTSNPMACGRRLFDHPGGWNGASPVGGPVFVVTHSVPQGWPRPGVPFRFVTDGIGRAVEQARAAAGDGIVAVAGANTVQGCLNAGLMDRLDISLVPVLMGRGIRLFDRLHTAPIRLGDPRVIEGSRVTHLIYDIERN